MLNVADVFVSFAFACKIERNMGHGWFDCCLTFFLCGHLRNLAAHDGFDVFDAGNWYCLFQQWCRRDDIDSCPNIDGETGHGTQFLSPVLALMDREPVTAPAE